MTTDRFYGNQHTENPFDDFGYDDLLDAIAELHAELERPPTTADAANDERFPSIKTIYKILESEWSQALREAGVEPSKLQQRAVPKDRSESMLEDIRAANEATHAEHLTMRIYDKRGNFATSSLKERFGSWTAACTEAGVSHGYRHGYTCRGPHGESLQSLLEHAIANALFHYDIDYEAHPRVPDTRWRADFLLTGSDLWLEVDGYIHGGRPNQDGFQRKIDHYQREEFDYAIVRSVEDLTEELRGHSSFSI